VKNKHIEFSRKYRAELHRYLEGGADRKRVRALGQRAIAIDLQVLELARIHEASLSTETRLSRRSSSLTGLIRKASLFFAEVIRPIEQTHRAARAAAAHLNQLNRTLKMRTAELAASNQELKIEIKRRANIEKALRKSEDHYSQLLEESGQLQKQLRYLSHQILSTQEEERKKISRELHDHIASTLTGISIELSSLKSKVTGNNRILKQRIATTQRLVQNSVELVHRFARELRPATLDDLGLIPALHSFTKALATQTGIRIRLTVFGGVEKLDNSKKTVLYRVTQEAIANVAKHAGASQVEVDISKIRTSVALSIRDNGSGFQVNRTVHSGRKKGLGLLGMRERVEMLDGTFNILSMPGKGTTVQATIPIHNNRRRGSLSSKADRKNSG
jgi:signal transduction histidine kinase